MNVIRYKYVFLWFSGALVLASMASVALWGLRLGIDFTGGSLMEIEFSDTRPTPEEIRILLAPLNLGSIALQYTEARGMMLRFRDVDESAHQRVLAAITEYAAKVSRTDKADKENAMSPVPVTEKRFDAIGPAIGAELRTRALWAIALTVSAIVLYIAWAFRRISKPVASWKYGVAAVAALAHDLLIPTGVFAALGRFSAVEIDILFITALLTILGFSVHDTIVVFDRIRENLHKPHRSGSYAETVNQSIRETVVRSVLTSLTVLVVLTIVFFLGGASTRYFALALIIGIAAGTYSSIFVASPLLVVWEDFQQDLSGSNSSATFVHAAGGGSRGLLPDLTKKK